MPLPDFVTKSLSSQAWKWRAERWLRRGELGVQRARDLPAALAARVVPPARGGLAILDDAFPSLRSGFRLCEYNGYLRELESVQVYSTARAFSALGERRPFAWVKREYENKYPMHAGRTSLLSDVRRLSARGAYTLFINNAFRMVERLERDRVPFMFTLYPGGGFALEQAESDRMLRRVVESPYFRGVITTQRITNEYLQSVTASDATNVHFIYGGVFPVNELVAGMVERRHFPREKRTFDVCFVAHRYMPGGADKGYDTFLQTARILRSRYDDVCFHVVGPWTESDGDVGAIRDRVTFHGSQANSFFAAFYSGMDAIVSANRPFLLRPGAFDGFPTGACMEAGMCGVPVLCSDILRQNVAFVPNEEILILPPDAEAYADELSRLRQSPERWAALSAATAAAFRRVFGEEAQLRPRIALLRLHLGTS